MYLVGVKGKAGSRLEFEDQIYLLWKALFNPLLLDCLQVFLDLMNLSAKVGRMLGSLDLPQWVSMSWSPRKIYAIRTVGNAQVPKRRLRHAKRGHLGIRHGSESVIEKKASLGESVQ